MKTMYEVRERGTDKLVGTYKSRSRARSRVDALDNAYGCYHYYMQEVSAK